jgi:hypothetical protein
MEAGILAWLKKTHKYRLLARLDVIDGMDAMKNTAAAKSLTSDDCVVLAQVRAFCRRATRPRSRRWSRPSSRPRRHSSRSRRR